MIRCAGAGDLPGATAMAAEVVRPRDAADLARAAGALALPLLAMSEATARRNGPFRRVVAPADRRAPAAAPCRSGVGPVSRTLH